MHFQSQINWDVIHLKEEIQGCYKLKFPLIWCKNQGDKNSTSFLYEEWLKITVFHKLCIILYWLIQIECEQITGMWKFQTLTSRNFMEIGAEITKIFLVQGQLVNWSPQKGKK